MKNPLPLIIGIIIILAAVAGGAWYMNSSKGVTTTETPVAPGEGTMMSMVDLLNMGRSVKCTFSYNDAGNTSEGTTYVSGKNVRSDFANTDSTGKLSSGSMINDTQYMYTWTTDTKEGVKMAITDDMMKVADEEKEKYLNDDKTTQMDPNQKVEYTCENWSADQSIFTPPADVNFVDYSAQMQQMQESMKQMGGEQCQACTNLTGDAADMCKKSLGCE